MFRAASPDRANDRLTSTRRRTFITVCATIITGGCPASIRVVIVTVEMKSVDTESRAQGQR
ncbi:hypothetical protein L208DRAFT_1393515 [Tricholoma matsutake]|nr:hypothetical protein L208DRAFT_1393515 [Tricholoma matsutake 945]